MEGNITQCIAENFSGIIYKRNEKNSMVEITKTEKEAVRERFPRVHIVRTMKQKSKRHKYYYEESRAVMRFLDELRNQNLE